MVPGNPTRAGDLVKRHAFKPHVPARALSVGASLCFHSDPPPELNTADTPTTVNLVYATPSVELLAECDPEVGRRIRETAFESICRLQTRMVLLGQTSALEKVSSFLLEMADRSTADAAGTVALPMSRYDIADYLGVAVETVSRALTVLRHRGAIAFSSARLVRILDREALERAADGRPVRQLKAAASRCAGS